jgi:hypothetical protein
VLLISHPTERTFHKNKPGNQKHFGTASLITSLLSIPCSFIFSASYYPLKLLSAVYSFVKSLSFCLDVFFIRFFFTGGNMNNGFVFILLPVFAHYLIPPSNKTYKRPNPEFTNALARPGSGPHFRYFSPKVRPGSFNNAPEENLQSLH